MREVPVARLRFNVRDPAFVEDPYATYAALRSADPVHRGPLGTWVLTRYADVEAAFADPRLGSAPAPHATIHRRNRERYVAADVASHILPFQDPPLHTTRRTRISKAFNAHVAGKRPRIQVLADRFLAPHLESGTLDVIGDFARPFANATICYVLGLPEADSDQLARWSEWFFYLWHAIPSTSALGRIEGALSEFRSYLAEVVEERARAPRDDLISVLLQATDVPDGLSRMELIDTCMLLFADGVENVDSGIGNAILALLQHPDQLDALRAHPELAASAVEECLRFEPPGQFIGRVAREDLSIHGQEIRAGQVVMLVLASANRDPARFEEPDRLDISRRDNPHLTLGRGRHSCIGARLVRWEMEVAIEAVAQRLPGVVRVNEVPDWQARPGHRWLESLPVRFDAIRGAGETSRAGAARS